jgi:hypothetical protein
MDTDKHLYCLFRDYCNFSKKDISEEDISKEDISKEYISEEYHSKFLIFLRENGLNEIGDIVIHTQSYSQTIEFGKEFVRRKNGINSFVAAIAYKAIILAMKEPICPENVQEFLAFLNTIDDRFVPRGRDHIFQVFKEKIIDNFNVRMSLDGLSKTAVYYVLIHIVIPGLSHQFRDSRDMPYTQNGIQHSYKLAKLLASLWIAIVIPNDKISEDIFCHFNDVYTNKWVLDGIDSMITAYIAFGGGECRIIEFEESQRVRKEESRREESREVDSGKQSEVDTKKTSKQKRQAANKLKKIII